MEERDDKIDPKHGPFIINVSHGKNSYTIEDAREDDTLASLQDTIAAMSGIEPQNQKLVSKYLKNQQKGENSHHKTLLECGINREIIEKENGTVKIMLIGSKKEEIEAVQKAISSRPVPIPQSRRGMVRPNKTIKKEMRFGNIQVLDLPNSSKARELLERLANDRGIVAVMEKHNWKVGLLREMSPAEVTKLGHNVNMGLEISLRLRFEDGFRKYESIKDVMLHELTHMEISEHDETFYRLLRQLTKEAKELDYTQSKGHQIAGGSYGHGDGHLYDPGFDGEVEEDVMTQTRRSSGQKLGGTLLPSGISMRERALNAALGRITAEEQVIQDACGTSSESKETQSIL
eukprot:TRINITY_DN4843_c0_g1_i1.p1 TRINITY_DN4843_c0_g1~~TRINITY_DN4843_c0_g1_i1.p1  ORF type:complete len:346 (+),score=130.25 TRINITY_DN4843_c0_g1_i1:273-1310(+)